MTDQQPTPTNTKPDSDEANLYVKEIVERDQELRAENPVDPAEARQRRQARRKKVAVAVLAPIAVGLTAWNVTLGTRPPPIPPNAAHVAQVQVEIARALVERYNDSAGIYPLDLAATGFPNPTIDYWSDGERYTIAAQIGQSVAELRSTDQALVSMDALLDSAMARAQ